MKFRYLLILIIGIILGISGCKEDKDVKQKNIENTGKETPVGNEKKHFNIQLSKAENVEYRLGESLEIKLLPEKDHKADSVFIFANDKLLIELNNAESYTWDGTYAKTGTNTVEVDFYEAGEKTTVEKSIKILSDIKPDEYGFKVKNVYKHDVNAYTQGLFYKDGFMYEATGMKGESTIRKVKFETGEVLQSFAIPTDVFGEGIVLYDNKIIQISWRAERGFVYDFETFKLIDEFSYTGEGWGLCTDGKKIFMTNGSPVIQILDPNTYSVTETLEVCDDNGTVKLLNELEYINGEIYANIYQYEKIARIDPKTGKVLAYIELDGILPMNDWTARTDVLNGIAYDEKGKRLFVTGKYWPKLFEIELIKK